MQLDELTQQNAALVEQAAAASQSMAEQARALNDSMAKYRVAGGAGAASSERVNSKPAVERRAANRPWSGSSAKRATSAAPATAAKAEATNDQEWQEF
jgi:methyl-accepting chemotaxis protein